MRKDQEYLKNLIIPRKLYDAIEEKPEKASIAVSSNGCMSDPYGKRMFLEGVEELQKQKNPSHLIVCGREIKELDNYNNVSYYQCFSQRWKERVKVG